LADSGQTWDAFDFFTVSLTTADLAEEFGKSNTDITWGITLVLMFRSVGSIIFGIAADRYGRKWPFVINNILFIALELVRVLPFFFFSPLSVRGKTSFHSPIRQCHHSRPYKPLLPAKTATFVTSGAAFPLQLARRPSPVWGADRRRNRASPLSADAAMFLFLVFF